ncbi:MAG: hypothetical protein RI575_08345 [Balneolaceae bacterium]|nr:hypothetical protein [Balneolaceae bacterium]MDR9408671.1 hypothetical protein [Balneolaceae bacterium]
MNQHPEKKESGKPRKSPKSEHQIHSYFNRVLLVILTIEWAYLLYDQQWLSLFLVSLIISSLLAPVLFKNKMDLELPAEFHFMAVLFVFAALYLGEIQEFYRLIWWWDIALHTTAGLMMGIVGFLLVYILNESKNVELQMSAVFIALFAFMFAVTIGTIWEIFEFAVDQLFGFNMQKEMLGDPSGLTDTMWDIIVNAFGALIICVNGWWYLKKRQDFFIRSLIQKFIERNPSWFRR